MTMEIIDRATIVAQTGIPAPVPAAARARVVAPRRAWCRGASESCRALSQLVVDLLRPTVVYKIPATRRRHLKYHACCYCAVFLLFVSVVMLVME